MKANTIRVQPRPFTSVNEAMSQIALELLSDGDTVTLVSAEGETVNTLELRNYQLRFTPDYKNMITIPTRRWNFDKSVAEFLWYMTGTDKVEPILPYFKNWIRYQTDGVVNSNYGVKWQGYVDYVIKELTRDKFSRRAIINMFDSEKHESFHKDTPCTVSWEFLIRNDKLHMTVNMRSNDLWYGFSNDQFNNSLFHQLIFNELKQSYPELQMGEYVHNATSMHVYESTCDRQKLANLWREFSELQEIERYGKRFSMNNDVTFTDFWTYDQFKIDFPETFTHFNKYRK